MANNRQGTTPQDGLPFEAITHTTIFENTDLQESCDVQVSLLWKNPTTDDHQGLQFPYNYLKTFCDDFLKAHDRHYGFHPLERPDPDNVNIVIPGSLHLDNEVVALILRSLRDALSEGLRNPGGQPEFKPFNTSIYNNLTIFTALETLKLEHLCRAWEGFLQQALLYGPLDSARELKCAYDVFGSNERLVQGMIENFAYRKIQSGPQETHDDWERPQDELVLGIPIAKAEEKVREVSKGTTRGHTKWLMQYLRGVRDFERWMESNGQPDFEEVKMQALQGSFVRLS